MADCIFCNIIQGKIPSYKVYEDDEVLAFLDITQVTKGHTLLVPKTHARNLLEMTPDASARLFQRLPEIARHLQENLGAEGMNIVNNNEALAGQTVFHTHIHLLPRYGESDGFQMTFTEQAPDAEALEALANELAME